MSDTSMNQQLSDTFLRNGVTTTGTGVLCGAATVGALVALTVAPRTTLGLAALGSGLVVAGNHDRLRRFAADRRPGSATK